MLNKKIYLFAFLLIGGAVFSSFDDNQSQFNSQTDKDHWLLVDGQTSLFNYVNQATQIEGKPKILMYSGIKNAILIYDFKQRVLEKKIKYDKQGPNRLNGMQFGAGIKLVNKDTLIIYSQEARTISISNLDGDVLSRTRIKNDSVSFGSVSIASPFAKKGGFLYMQSLPHTVGKFETDYKNRPNMIGKINMSTGETKELLFDYPQVYQGKKYSQYLEMMDIVYNPNIDKFILSFPLSDSLYVTDFSGNTQAYLAKSKLVNNREEIDENRNDIGPSQITSHYFWTSDAYGKLIHDPVSGYYFREAREGLKERNYVARDFSTKKEVLVFDANFKQVRTLTHSGATLMYHAFDNDIIYWNKDFQKYNFDTGNEDTIYFEGKKFY